MINVPFTVVVPTHSRLKLALQMLFQIRNGIADKRFPLTTLACVQTLSNGNTDISADSELRFL